VVYDVTRRLVKILYRDTVVSGRHVSVSDGRDTHGLRVAAGVYFVRLDPGAFQSTRKIVRLRPGRIADHRSPSPGAARLPDPSLVENGLERIELRCPGGRDKPEQDLFPDERGTPIS
jgi:hypothetical protein